MSIVLIIFWFDVLAAFICAATERFFLCGVNVVLAVLLAYCVKKVLSKTHSGTLKQAGNLMLLV